MFIKIEKIPDIVKTISKTKREEFPDLKKCLEMHKAEIAEEEREQQRKLMAEQKAEKMKVAASEKEKSDFFKMQQKEMKEMGSEKKAKVFYGEDGEEESKNETGELDDDFW